MSAKNTYDVRCEDLPGKVDAYRARGYRLVHLSCTEVSGTFAMHYAFSREGDLEEMDVTVSGGDSVPSITRQFPYAVVLENEIHERHGIFFHGTSVDFKGLLYRISASRPCDCRSPGERDRQE